eukprot:gene25141-31562_t
MSQSSRSPVGGVDWPQIKANQLRSCCKTLGAQLRKLNSLLSTSRESVGLFERLNILLSASASLPMFSSSLFSEGSPSIATLLVQIHSTELLQSVFAWPGLTLRVPVSNSGLIASAIPTNLRSPVGLMQTKVSGGVSVLTSPAASSHLRATRDAKGKLTRNLMHSVAFTSSAGFGRFADKTSEAVSRTGDGRSVSFGTPVSADGPLSHSGSAHTHFSDKNDLIDAPLSEDFILSQPASTLSCQAVDMDSPRSLHQVGFTLLQLVDARCFSASLLLRAGYPLPQLRTVNGLHFSVSDLRAAGYSASQCHAARYSLTELFCGGEAFNAEELTRGGLFSEEQLREVGCDSQRFALGALFAALGGPQWRRAANWCSCWPLEEWHGVTVNEKGQVIALKLGGNFLKGSIPTALSLLPFLRSVDFQNNKICGAVPCDSLRRLGCTSFVLDDASMVFTGDALLIRG